jgi:hypothetical protein
MLIEQNNNPDTLIQHPNVFVKGTMAMLNIKKTPRYNVIFNSLRIVW